MTNTSNCTEKQVQIVLTNLLFHKLKAEYKTWYNGIYKLSKVEIIKNADSFILFKNVIDLIGDSSEYLSVDCLRTLLSLDNALMAIQRAWFNRDKGVYGELESAITELSRVSGSHETE